MVWAGSRSRLRVRRLRVRGCGCPEWPVGGRIYVRTMHQGERRQGAAASGSGGLPAGAPGGAAPGGATPDGATPDGAAPGGATPGDLATVAFADRLAVVDAARESLAGIEQVLHQCRGADLGPAMALLDALARRVEAAKVAVLGEALERGAVSSS